MSYRGIVLICILALIMAVFLLLGLYRYDRVERDGSSLPVRMNRITGHTEVFDGEKWWTGKKRQRSVVDEQLPLGDRGKTVGRAELKEGYFRGEIYNGSHWTVTRLDIEITVIRDPLEEYLETDLVPSVSADTSRLTDGEGTEFRRIYRHSLYLEPLSASSFSFEVLDTRNYASFIWRIDDVRGFSQLG